MFLDYLDRVRAKPRAARDRFVLFWSLVITGAIVLVWLSVLFGGAATPRPQGAAERATPSLTASLLDGFKENVASLRNEVGLRGRATSESQPTRSLDDLPALHNTWNATDRPTQPTPTPETAPATASTDPAAPIEPAPAPQPALEGTTGASTPTEQDEAFITTIMNEVATDTSRAEE